MRVEYVPLSPEDFDVLFLTPLKASRKLKGGGIHDITPFHSDIYNQRGSGILSIIGNMVRKSVPFLRKYVFPALHGMGSNLLNDFTDGANMKESLKTHGTNAVKKVLTGGKKRKRRMNKLNKKGTQRKNKSAIKKKPNAKRGKKIAQCSKPGVSMFD